MAKEISLPQILAPVRWEGLKGFEKLKPHEQTLARRKTADLIKHIHALGQDRLEVGKDLEELRDVFEPHGIFERYLKMEGLSVYNVSRATAYRLIENSQVARTILPAPNAQARIALLRAGSKLTRALVASHPPPKTRDPQKLIDYIEELAAPKRRSKDDLGDPDLVLQELIMRYCTLFERLPAHHKTRASFFHRAAGMMATISGLASETTVRPIAVPPDYRPGPRGRPRIHALDADEQ